MLAVLHLLVPWVLRWSATRGSPLVRRGVDDAYFAITTGLGALAVVLGGPVVPYKGLPGLLVAVAAGMGIPLLAALLSGHSRRFSRFPRRVTGTVLCATAEEMLWRLAALGALVDVGLPVPLAGLLSLAGFVLLHVPRSGWRVVPYMTVFGGVLTLLAGWGGGGVLAAALCHSVHNLVVAATTRRLPATDAPTGLPPSRAWGS